jgi:hypothetical protein
MTRNAGIVITVWTALLAPTSLAAQATAGHTLDDLAFMAGCWRGEFANGAALEEIYTAPSANLILGLSRFFRGDQVVQHEFSRITADSTGIALLPFPGGVPSEHAFRLTALTPGSATFEAPEHDFPKRIHYTAAADGSLMARIDGGTDESRAQEWRMRPLPCGQTEPAAHSPIFTFHSGFWLNLHHFLYVLGRVEATMPDITRRAVAGAPDDEARGLAAVSDSERRQWRAVVTAYANGPSRRDPVFDHDLIDAGMMLARAGDAASLDGTGVSPELAALLERAAPLYRRIWWESHERANRARERELDSLVSRHGAPVLAFITRVYPFAWPADGYPVQLAAWVNWAGAFSTGDRHLVVSSLDEGTRGDLGLEILFHEAMHQWDHDVQTRLDAAAAAAGKRIDGPLSHAMIFYTAGEAVRAAVPGHDPYAEVNGLWLRRMRPWKSILDEVWKPYLDGAGTFDDAVRRIVQRLP